MASVVDQAAVTCSGCGKVYRDLAELLEVRMIGLALAGSCPSCGARIPAGGLWRCKRRETTKVKRAARS
jgi:hypothetical protein